MAISSPLLETSINGAKGVIINVTASPDIGLDEIEIASSLIAQQADENANIIWGAAFDETMDDEISVTVIATGFDHKEEAEEVAASGAGKSADLSEIDDIFSIFNR